MTKKTYKVEDIFTDIPDDPDNVLMTIPTAIIKQLCLKEGDMLNVSVEKYLMILKKVDSAE
jgi:hypothetical protein